MKIETNYKTARMYWAVDAWLCPGETVINECGRRN